MGRTLAFLGAGNMAEAIARSAVRAGVLEASAIVAADRAETRREVFTAMGAAATADNAEAIRSAEQVVLAVKPQVFPQVAPQLAEYLRDDHVVVSIMAGLTCATIESAVGRAVRLVRVMPNTPVMAGQGMSAVALGPNAMGEDDALTLRLLEAGGRAVRVEESLLDAVTAVSGSGPAYAFYLAEAMERAADELGLGEHGRLLVGQTLLGAATLLCESQESPAELRRRVTSPGGTTEAAVASLDEAGVGDAIVAAVRRACERSRELAAD